MGCCSSTQTDNPLLSLDPEPFCYHEQADYSEHTDNRESTYVLDDDI